MGAINNIKFIINTKHGDKQEIINANHGAIKINLIKIYLLCSK